jgi:hypothetical protein
MPHRSPTCSNLKADLVSFALHFFASLFQGNNQTPIKSMKLSDAIGNGHHRASRRLKSGPAYFISGSFTALDLPNTGGNIIVSVISPVVQLTGFTVQVCSASISL